MPPILIDYGCHYFSFRLATDLSRQGTPIRYFANASLESPNLSSLPDWQRDHPGVVRTIACAKPYGKMSLKARLQGELEWARHCVAALQQESPSAVILNCVPLSASIRIHSWCRSQKIPIVYWLQDFQGRAIHDLLGRKFGLPGKSAGALAQLWEQQLLEQSAMVITIAPGHERELPSSIRTSGKYALLENWANVEDFAPTPPANDWSRRHGLHRTRNIVYSGTLGLKHDFEMFLDLAVRFLPEPDVRIVVVSSGQAASKLAREAELRSLPNLTVLPFQPQHEVPLVLASAAVLVAPLDASAGKFCIPSKVLSYLCAGRPIVLAIDSTNLAAKTIHRAGAGFTVPPGDPFAFSSAVARLMDDEPLRRDLGHRARTYAEHTFNHDRIAAQFVDVLARAHAIPQARPQVAAAG